MIDEKELQDKGRLSSVHNGALQDHSLEYFRVGLDRKGKRFEMWSSHHGL
jgi:hypothetical protein